MLAGIALVVGGCQQAGPPSGSPARSSSPAPPRTLDGCAGATEDRRLDCYEGALRRLFASGVRPAVFAHVNRHADRQDWFRRRCHMLMHPLGRSFGAGVRPSQLRHQGKDCAAGFLHGYLEHRLGSTDRLAPQLVRSLCSVSATPLQLGDCEHGIGHVLMRNMDNHLPKALARCRQLGPERFVRNCAGGAFMENRFAASGRDEARPTRFYREGHPGYMCRTGIPDDLLATCQAWAVRDVEQTRQLAYCMARRTAARRRGCMVAVGAVGDEPPSECAASRPCWYGRGYSAAVAGGADAVAQCLAAPTRRARLGCAEGAGFRLGTQSPRAGSRAATAACSSFGPALLGACLEGFANRANPVDFA